MSTKTTSVLYLCWMLGTVFAGCDEQGACTTIGIPAVRVTVVCDSLPELGDFEIMSKRSSDDTLMPCLTPNPVTCDESGAQVIVDCGPFRDPGESPADADYDVRLAQGDFVRDVTVFVTTDECHPDTVVVVLP